VERQDHAVPPGADLAVTWERTSNADVAGLAATVNAEQSHALNSLTAYQHLHAFTAYLRYSQLGDLMADDMARAPDAAARQALDRQRAMHYSLATEIEGLFFPARYRNPDSGNYDVERELGGLQADDERDKDLNPAPHFQKADRLRTKSTWLVGVLVAFAAALWFFSLAEPMKHALKYALALGGLAFTGIGVAAMLALELLL